MRNRKVHLQGTHTRKNRCYTTIYIIFSWDIIHFLLAGFFAVLAFFVLVLFVAFFAAGAALLVLLVGLDDALGAAGAAPAVVPLDDFGFGAAFFFGDAAFFFGLLALAADFGLAVFDFGFAAFDFGLAVVAFFAPVDAFFLAGVAAGAVVDAGAVAAGALDAVAELLVAAAAAAVEAVAGFLLDAFFVGDAERFRFVPLADFGLLDEDAFFAAAFFGLAEADFFAGDFFFLPAADAFLAGAAAPPTLKLPLAPTPFVCFKDLFFVPARKADLTCWLAVVVFTLKLAKIYFKIAAFEAPRRSFNCVIACFIIAEYFG
jgi:hypothetical protein